MGKEGRKKERTNFAKEILKKKKSKELKIKLGRNRSMKWIAEGN